ncbi:MAG TPA: hypothetical protein PKC03_07185 [Dokdonella sp.]|jgi:hypothetical protein|nr:hypothetical protein [Dokdonella sp.]
MSKTSEEKKFDDVLKRMLSTPPTPQKSKETASKPKPKPNKDKKKSA